MLSINDILMKFDPNYRLKSQKLSLDTQLAKAKLDQKERHHFELLEFQRQKLALEQHQAEAQNLAILERERIAGKNAMALSVQNFIFEQLNQNSQLLSTHYTSVLERQRDWGNNIASIRKSLFEIEADTIRQKALSRQNHLQEMERMKLASQLKIQEQQQVFDFSLIEQKFKQKQELEKMILEYNLKFLETELNHLIQNKRVTYDGINSIVMRLIERVVGLSEQATAEDVSRWVDEAMAGAYK